MTKDQRFVELSDETAPGPSSLGGPADVREAAADQNDEVARNQDEPEDSGSEADTWWTPSDLRVSSRLFDATAPPPNCAKYNQGRPRSSDRRRNARGGVE